MKKPDLKAAPIWRRFAAIFYDSFVVIAIWMLAVALTLPLSNGEAVKPGNIWMQIYLFCVASAFFIFFWRKAGQTLGMRAWRIKLVHEHAGHDVSTLQLLARTLLAVISWAALGLGFVWCFFDPAKSSLHDRLTHTRLVQVNGH